MFELASGQDDSSQAGIPGEDAFLEEAIGQLKVDIRGEVFQVKPAGDPGPSKPQPMRVRVGREPPAQDVADHGRRACPGIASYRWPRRSSHFPRAIWLTSVISTDVNPP